MATLYEYYITGDDAFKQIRAAEWVAQTFTPSTAHKITSVKIKCYRVGSPGTMTVGIRTTDGSGHPTGGDLCSGTINGNDLTEDSGGLWYEITLGAGYILSADTKYAIVVRCPDGGAVDRVDWRMDASSATYPGGCREYSTNSGSSWVSATGYDMMFEDWGIEVPTVTTQAVTDIEKTTATGNGTIVSVGLEDADKRGVCWNTTGNPTVADDKSEETDSFGTGAFTRPMTGLTPGEHYYVKAYAHNSEGYSYGGQVEFTTPTIGAIIRVIQRLTLSQWGPQKPIHVSGNVYAISYSGWLRTVSISDDGLTLSEVASLEFDIACSAGVIIHISGNIYAIVGSLTPPLYPCRLKTVSISEDGLTLSEVASLEVDTVQGHYPHIIHISGNVYAIAYQGPGYDGWLKTVSISEDGLTLALTSASLEFDTVKCLWPKIIHISGNIYAIAYYLDSPYYLGRLKTVSISEDGLTLALTSASLEFVTGEGANPDIIHVSGNVYAVAYYTGRLTTVSISDDGLTLSNKATLVFSTGGHTPRIIHVSGNVYAIAYGEGPYGYQDGWLRTMSISDDGLTLSEVASLEFDTAEGRIPHIIHISGDVYAIAYSITDYGKLLTVEITTSLPPTVTTNPATGIGATTATLNGTLDDDCGAACECVFEWGPDVDKDITTPTESKTTGQLFSQVIGGLAPNTTYHFRAIATNLKGTSYGADRSFTTALIISRAFALGREEL